MIVGGQLTTQRVEPGFRGRLMQAIGNAPPFAWASRMGIEKATFDGLVNKGAIPTTKTLYKIALNSNVSINWLLTGQGPQEISSFAVAREEPTVYSTSDYVLVPRYDVMASAGGGRSVHSEQIVDHLAFKTDWVKRVMGLEPNHLALITVKGDSMVPTLKEEDMVLLDLRDQQVRNDAIYVLRWEDMLIAKRLQRGFDGAIHIQSDNPVYHRQVVPVEQADKLRVIGRVVWTGRRV